MIAISEIKGKAYELGEKIGVEKSSTLYPIFSEATDIVDLYNDGTSVYVENSTYNYIIMNRGNISRQYKYKDVDGILYAIFKSITFQIASDYEKSNRKENEDFRRQLFDKQLELLSNINKNFAERRKKEIDEILKISPFRDSK